jgi:hypothetical protein
VDFAMVPLMLGLWGDRWLPLEGGPAIVRFHSKCGNPLDVSLMCSHCDEELLPDEVQFSDEDADVNPETLSG